MDGEGQGRSRSDVEGLTRPAFESPIDELQHPELGLWRANVGAPVELDLAPAAPARLVGFDVLSWNLAVGAARLMELLRLLDEGAFPRARPDPDRPLVILAQEAYRADATVPESGHADFHGGALHPEEPRDVVAIAHQRRLSLRYAPSMRNGRHRSDRGNAILSTVALGTAHAFLLPYVRQRRVVVAAEIAGHEGIALASAHLDVGGQLERRRIGKFGGGRALQAESVAHRLAHPEDKHSLVIGADLNTPLGLRDPATRALVSAGLHPATRIGRWRHTFHGPIRLPLDHILFRSPDRRIRSVHVARLDELAGDRGKRIFGSDHHPLLAHVELG